MSHNEPVSEREEFDRIVEGLDFDLRDLGDLDAAAERAAAQPELPDATEGPVLEFDEMPDEAFYREAPPARLGTRRSTIAAWIGVGGPPVVMVLAAILDIWIDSTLMVGLTLVSVASLVYLIYQLPERGPSNQDWPDDGAAL